MRKTMMKVGLLGLQGVILASVMMLASCSKGFDSDETFSSTVKDSQLTSPTLTKANFSQKVNSDGSESIQVTWDAVMGAGGYYYRVDNVDGSEPVLLVEGNTDKSMFLFPKAEDTKYRVTVKTLGNEKLNNKAATEATEFAYSTMIEAQTIPNGQDIAAFIKANIKDTDDEQAFELEAGGSYEINEEIDFGKYKVTFRGNKVNYPIVTFGYDGVIRTAASLKVKWIKFDCTGQNSKGVFEGSSNPPSSLEGSNFTGFPDNVYYLQDPIIFQDCWFKNVNKCLFYSGECSWGIEDLRVVNCLVQLDNDGTKFGDAAVICTYSGTSYYRDKQSWYGAVRNVTIKESTIYNLKDNAKNRMIRFLNKSFAKTFDSSAGSATLTNNTFIKTMSDKEFANNTPNAADYTITFNGNVLYICARLAKFIQGSNTVICDVNKNTSYTLPEKTGDGARFANDFKYCTEEDPGFTEADLKELDLNAPNGGLNLKAKGTISSTIGDPRWLQ